MLACTVQACSQVQLFTSLTTLVSQVTPECAEMVARLLVADPAQVCSLLCLG